MRSIRIGMMMMMVVMMMMMMLPQIALHGSLVKALDY